MYDSIYHLMPKSFGEYYHSHFEAVPADLHLTYRLIPIEDLREFYFGDLL